MTEHANPDTCFERKDVNIPALLAIAGGLVVTVVIACLVSWGCFDFLQARDRASKVSPFPLAATERGQLPPEPRLEQLDRMQAAEEHRQQNRLYDAELTLMEKGGVDEKKNIVYIPIDQAMKMIVDQHLLRSRPEAKKADKENGRQP